MSYNRLADVHAIRTIEIQNSWKRCTVELEHSVSGDYYWLMSRLVFRSDEDDERIWFELGKCHRNDPETIIFPFLDSQGFRRTNQRFMREWEYHDFERTSQAQED